MTLTDPRDDSASRRARRVALPLVAIVLVLTVAGALWVTRFASAVRQDPGLVYRDPSTLDKLLKRGRDAEAAGDRGTAITTYRFVVAVGAGDDSTIARYVAAARAGLARLGEKPH